MARPKKQPQPDAHDAPHGDHADTVARPEPLRATVPMVRDADTNPPPYTADVHPDEVENWQAFGWRLAD